MSISQSKVGLSQTTKSPAPSPGWRKKNLTGGMTIPMQKKKKNEREMGNIYIFLGQHIYIVHTVFPRCIPLAARQSRVLASVPYQNVEVWVMFSKFSSFLHCHTCIQYLLLILCCWLCGTHHGESFICRAVGSLVGVEVGQQGEVYLGFVSGQWDGAVA